MVNNHYRWDFIGLSTDEKPTPETSEKVVDGSTFYCSDTSTLYVFCKDNWYERKALGDGGGGSSINVVQTTGTSTTDVMSQKAVTDALAESGGVTPVQTTGSSTTDVMSQNATTSMVFQDPSTRKRVQIGDNSSAGTDATAIGSSATADTSGVALGNGSRGNVGSVTVGKNARSFSRYGVALGNDSYIGEDAGQYSVALGWGARTSRRGEVNVSTGLDNYGYNNTKYRVIGGVHDPVDAHDAATKGYVDTLIAALEARIAALEGN